MPLTKGTTNDAARNTDTQAGPPSSFEISPQPRFHQVEAITLGRVYSDTGGGRRLLKNFLGRPTKPVCLLFFEPTGLYVRLWKSRFSTGL